MHSNECYCGLYFSDQHPLNWIYSTQIVWVPKCLDERGSIALLSHLLGWKPSSFFVTYINLSSLQSCLYWRLRNVVPWLWCQSKCCTSSEFGIYLKFLFPNNMQYNDLLHFPRFKANCVCGFIWLQWMASLCMGLVSIHEQFWQYFAFKRRPN